MVAASLDEGGDETDRAAAARHPGAHGCTLLAVPVSPDRMIRLPPEARSAARARQMLRDALDRPGLDPDLVDTVVLLASELCENAVLHAGTEFELALTLDHGRDEGAPAGAPTVTVAVTDRGAGPLEMHLRQPRRGYGRAATHGRGLELVSRLARAWGTRHDADGRHTTWFTLGPGDAADLAPRPDLPPSAPATPDLSPALGPSVAPAPAATPRSLPGAAPSRPAPPEGAAVRSAADQARRLLSVPAGLVERLRPEELVAELARRLREGLDAASVVVALDEGDGAGATEIVRDGEPAAGSARPAPSLEVALPLTPPLRGTLTVTAPASGGPEPDELARDLAELVAQRVATVLHTRWLREVDQRRRAWMAYLADTSELLGQSLDVDLAVTVVPQIVVPRLGRWCAVHLIDAAGRLRLAALTHADEEEIPELRAALDPDARPGIAPRLRSELAGLLRSGGAPTRVAVPTDGLAVPLRTRGRTIGTLLVGRPAGRAHAPEDVVMTEDIARRAALAIQNAQSTAAHVAVSQALQQALLPRALPVAAGVEFAAAYRPASTGSDVGGDFYDVLTIDPTRWLVSIGDVCGKGARAAARTGLVRDVLRVLVRGGRAVPAALELLNEVMMEAADPLQYCTLAAAAVSRPAAGGLDVELVLAGHPRAVLVRAHGTAEPVGAFGTAVGLVPTIAVTPTHHRLGPGDSLLVHTDGVTERRRGTEQFGSERLLAAAAGAAGGPASALVTAVLEALQRFSPGPGGDDVALLVVRAGS